MRKLVVGTMMAAVAIVFCGQVSAGDIPDPEDVKLAPKFLIINLGPKNATFDEKVYPDLTIVYTPNIKIDKREETCTATGSPELLAKWINGKSGWGRAMLFDKNGIGVFEGWLNRFGGQLYTTINIDKNTDLRAALKKYVREGAAGQEAANKKLDVTRLDEIIGIKMPDFEIVTADGEKKMVRAMIAANAYPTMVVFYSVPQDVKFMTKKQIVEEAQAKFDFMAAAKNSPYAETTPLLNSIESEIFQNTEAR
ncbi:MAG: hypothetical protein MUC35_04320 [Candidatus Margulisbacteria bacterium]|jgi:hypothetical protein|nr:hypothetical protein [Candidatus Margulisiibacteriota bacterium]